MEQGDITTTQSARSYQDNLQSNIFSRQPTEQGVIKTIYGARRYHSNLEQGVTKTIYGARRYHQGVTITIYRAMSSQYILRTKRLSRQPTEKGVIKTFGFYYN
jgi:hypothetical protein